MSNIRLFFNKSLSNNFKSKLDKPQSHYLIKVMRLKVGSKFSLFNQTGEWEAKLENTSKGLVEFIVEKQIRHKIKERDIWLAFTPIKSSYFNFMIQKATELGTTKFIPIFTERTIVRKINNERLKKIIIESCEQSNRINVPDLLEAQSLENFLTKNKSINLIFGDLNTDNKKIRIEDKKPNCILIGPEGDFSDLEREKILNFNGTQSIKLNNNILRSETAVISALSVISYLQN